MNIFNLTEEYLSLMREIEDNEGELTPELEEQLSINQSNFESKLRNYRYMILMLNSDINLIDDEIERLESVKAAKTKTIDRLKNTMLEATMLLGYDGKSGNKKLDFYDFKLYTVNRQSVEIEDESTFNDPEFVKITIGDKLNFEDYKKIKKLNLQLDKVSTSISKIEIGNALKEGRIIEGAKFIIKPYLNIK